MSLSSTRSSALRILPILAGLLALAAIVAIDVGQAPPLHSAPSAGNDFANFESLPVHPLAITPDGTRLLALNIPDARLQVFTIGAGALTSAGEVFVGLEPVSVAALNDTIAYVVNQLSDDVSVVNLNSMRVVATARVGDEPTDVVFAGSTKRAFVCVSGEDAVKIYSLGAGGVPAATPDVVRPIFGRHPRALATRGNEVYVAVLDAGNRTTALSAAEVRAGGGPPPPNPPLKTGLPPPPDVGLIVQKVGADWVDERPATVKTWNAVIPYDLPDQDVTVLDASSGSVIRTVSDVGTNLFNVAVAPGSGNLYVTNTEALNRIRFEPNVRGRFLRNRITRIDAGGVGAVTAWHLNAHVVYDTIPGPPGEKDLSLAEPIDLAVNAAESKIYVAALGSDKVGVVDPGSGTVTARVGTSAAPRPTKSGPTGLALDEPRHQLYVLNRFTNSIAILNTLTESFTAEVSLAFDPSPAQVTEGRRFLYDGMLSDHGDLACASCHIGANFDNIAWDLGNPQGDMQPAPPGSLPGVTPFHPMKGPMTTQSLRGLGGTPPFHWRGDRADFTRFNPAFIGLMGNTDSLSTGDMQKYNDFILTVLYPPNPNENLNRTLPDPAAPAPSPTRGKTEFDTKPHDGAPCTTCHALPTGTNGTLIPGPALQESQAFKVPQLRNMYQKTGFTDGAGAQKRGFGFMHDGSMDNIFDFLHLPVFNFANEQERRDLEAFVLAFDTGTAPSVGREITVNGANKALPGTTALLDSLYAAADLGQCDLVAHGRVLGGAMRGFVYQTGLHSFLSDLNSEGTFPADSLQGLAQDGGEITYLGVPPGSGTRMGIDRDRDGYRDRWELKLGSNPADPTSMPSVTAVEVVPAPSPTRLFANHPNPFNPSTVIPFSVSKQGRVTLRLFNVSGALVRTLVEANAPPGYYEPRWDGRDDRGLPAASGRYYVQLTAWDGTKTRTLTLLK